MEKIKIVIWDLDDTFWRGTLSEGEIEPIEENIRLIKTLVDRGIMNSICSKNNYNEAKNKLVELGIWDYFIFPCINWNPKGPQVKQLLSDCSLREVNAIFVDDNVQNLNEVKYYCPKINAFKPESIEELACLEGNNDLEHKRLKQYRVLEKKKEALATFKSNEDFLYASNIKVYFRNDCEKHFDRILDLINRSNQLNFTKKRMDSGELKLLLADPNITSGYVVVEDDYGEYGIVGFYSLKANKAEHFLFSCRTIGMGIEQYVYSKLDYPDINIVGEVRTKLLKDIVPGWINKEDSEKYNEHKLSQTKNKSLKKKTHILISGGCDLEQLAAYLKIQDGIIKYKFNIGHIRHDNTFYQVGTLTYSKEQRKDLAEHLPFVGEETFDGCFFDPIYDVVVFSLLMDYTQAVYKSKMDKGIVVTYGDYNDTNELSIDNLPSYFSIDGLDYLNTNFTNTGAITPQDLVKNLEFMRDHLRENTILILINGCEVPIENEYEKDRYKKHIQYNKIVDEFAQRHKNTYVLDVRKIITERSQLSDNIRHYQREVYYEMAKELSVIINRETNTEMLANHSSTCKYKINRFAKIIKSKMYNLKGKR